MDNIENQNPAANDELVDDELTADDLLPSTADVDVVLNDLEMMANNFSDHVQGIRLMQENGFFKFASKDCRNELLDGMRKQVDALDETTQVAFRALKKVKRQRVPDTLVDSFLVGSVLPGRL
jgi:hypothetical protein